MLTPEYIISKWCETFHEDPAEMTAQWEVWFRFHGWHHPEIVKMVDLATTLHNAEVQISGLNGRIDEMQEQIKKDNAAMAFMRDKHKETVAELNAKCNSEHELRVEYQNKWTDEVTLRNQVDETFQNNVRREELLEKKEKEIGEAMEILREFGIGPMDEDIAADSIRNHIQEASVVLWGGKKKALVKSFIMFATKHLGQGWSKERFWIFWEELFSKEEFQNVMCECNLKAKFNLKLVLNILSWLRHKGVIALSQTDLDAKMKCPVSRFMYLTNYLSNNPNYSALSPRIQEILSNAYAKCAVLKN